MLFDDVAAMIPAKGVSVRVPDKNFRPFFKGLCLVECKVLSLQALGVKTIKISSNDARAEKIARDLNVDFARRSERAHGQERQISDWESLSHWVNHAITGWEDRLVYWAFATSPFVSATSIAKGIEMTRKAPQKCTLGVQVLQEYMLDSDGQPLNYDPTIMPRSQDLEPMFRITCGVNMAWGQAFIDAGTFMFTPPSFLPLPPVECVDINTEEEWALAVELAPSALRDI